jgi:hypothetical protein
MRFSPIFSERIGVFLINQCYDDIFQKLAVVPAKTPIFRQVFGENIYKIITSGPRFRLCQQAGMTESAILTEEQKKLRFRKMLQGPILRNSSFGLIFIK